jgi:hypothetical protein
MRVAVQTRAADFDAAARRFLLVDEANHTFLLNRLARGDRDADRGPWWSATIHDGRRLVACAARDRQAVFLSDGPAASWEGLANTLRHCSWLEHVIGAEPAAHGVVQALGRRWRLHLDLPLLQLHGAPDAGPNAPPGRITKVQAEDDALVADWSLAFHDEAGLVDARSTVPQQARRRRELGELFLWRDASDHPVCLAGGFLIPPGGARIAPVYTPAWVRASARGGPES